MNDQSDKQDRSGADYESQSISRQEYISAIVHLYRGELYRANSWRMRLDTTTNWAILTSAGLLSFSFSGPDHTHWVLLTGIILISALLSFEARRFRFFDVWRFRVRMIEENFYGPLLRRDPVSPDQLWGLHVADDLLHPSFKITYRAAIRARFTRNYWVIYGVLLAGWALKVMLEPTPAHTWEELKNNMTAGAIPWWVALTYVAGVVAMIGVILLAFPRTIRSEEAYWSPGKTTDTGRDVPAWDT